MNALLLGLTMLSGADAVTDLPGPPAAEALVAELGHDRYYNREKAYRELRYSPWAYRSVVRGTRSKDAEIRRRCYRLLEERHNRAVRQVNLLRDVFGRPPQLDMLWYPFEYRCPFFGECGAWRRALSTRLYHYITAQAPYEGEDYEAWRKATEVAATDALEADVPFAVVAALYADATWREYLWRNTMNTSVSSMSSRYGYTYCEPAAWWDLWGHFLGGRLVQPEE